MTSSIEIRQFLSSNEQPQSAYSTISRFEGYGMIDISSFSGAAMLFRVSGMNQQGSIG